MDLYLSSDGNDDNDGKTPETALKTFDQACFKMIEYGNQNVNWKIYVSGTIKNGTKDSAEYGQCKITSDVTKNNAHSILLTGLSEPGADGTPSDMIDRGLTPVNGAPETGSALRIETEVPVTVTNLEITRGFYSKGAGLFVSENSTVTLGDGVFIIGNTTGSGNGRGGGVHNEGTLFMYGSAVVGNPAIT